MHRAAKPGHRSGEQEERAAFTTALIQALEEASQRGSASNEASLARAAYDKLQFDFPVGWPPAFASAGDLGQHSYCDCGDLGPERLPRTLPQLVSGEELTALAQAHRAGPGFPLTPKYLAVVRKGASAAGGCSHRAVLVARGRRHDATPAHSSTANHQTCHSLHVSSLFVEHHTPLLLVQTQQRRSPAAVPPL